MVTELPRRTSFSGPTLVRLLSRTTRVDVVEPAQSPAARLDQWLGWTESILLSKVLNAPAAAVSAKLASRGSAAEDDVVDVVELAQAEYARLRDSLEQAIFAAAAPPQPLPAAQRRQLRAGVAVEPELDIQSYRRRYSMLQQKMQGSIAALRTRLRGILAATSPDMARLAAVDAAMGQALAERETSSLAGLPGLLEEHFERLPQEGRNDLFLHDLSQVLKEELELRLQPIQGLLSAISTTRQHS